MSMYTQADRPLRITLGPDQLLVTRFRGNEAISQLFRFELDLLAASETTIPFDGILCQSMTIEMRTGDGGIRYFNGLVSRFSQGARDETFTAYRAVVVPNLWLLTKKIRSRIFQQLSIPDILRAVLTGLDVTYQIRGTYYPRDYCVQYRESDFDFASRLMEEEGIYYFFAHSASGHHMIVTDAANPHPAVSGQTSAVYDEVRGGVRDDMRVTAWEKSQELRSGEYTLWDHCFELPGNTLEVNEKTTSEVKVGKVTHKLNIGGNDQLEIYEYPGCYAQRFDGIDRNGAERRQDLKHILEDGERTVRIRMEEQEARTLEISGASDCGNFTAGHMFALERHFNADGKYVLTRVEHDATTGGYRSGQELEFRYQNRFTCIPDTLPYRPPRLTGKPVIAGIQTATVTGPPSEDTSGQGLFCDKYGRVKVQFHWDREGKKDQTSSCWLRVAQLWAGKGWGAFFWPRIGHEVVVSFEDGDPDKPLIVGSVYNAANMPPYVMPDKSQLGGIRSASVRGDSSQNFNGVVFNDEKGKEHLSIHSEHNMTLNTEYDKQFHAGRNKGERVSGADIYTVGSLPSGGGSGGGGDFDSGSAITHPPPAGVLGLNATMTYGETLGGTLGLYYQLVFGNGTQICINPFGLARAVGEDLPLPGVLTSLLGSGLGGNLAMTIGANSSFNVGPSYEIKMGDKALTAELGMHDDPFALITLGILGVLNVILVLAYGLTTTDVKRANLTIAFQVVFEACLAFFVSVVWSRKNADDGFTESLKGLFYPSLALDMDREEFKDMSGWQKANIIGSWLYVVGALGEPLLALDETEQ